jgi:peptidoglycan/xylan/chitin deacetylase (PgdA/CDA1 family)
VLANDGNHVFRRPVLDRDGIVELRAIGMEIGSHSLTHANLTKCSDPARELSESKERLEQILAEPILSFCYPGGKFNGTTCALARAAGYKLARTTVAFQTGLEFDPFRMPVTLRFFPRGRVAHTCQAAKSANLRGLANWYYRWHVTADLERLIDRIIDDVSITSGIFHLWGHSWEIEAFGLWKRLEAVFEYLAGRPGIRYLTNSEMLGSLRSHLE